MKTLSQFKLAGILVILLGIIHLCATPFIFPVFKANIHLDLTSVYMFIMVGFSTVFLGWIQFFILKRIKDNAGFRQILIVSVLFLNLLGIGAVATMRTNPFAYICLAIALYEWILFRSLGSGNKVQ